MLKIIFSVVCVFAATQIATAVTLSFGPTDGVLRDIPGTDDGTGNPIQYSSTLISGGTAVTGGGASGNHAAGSGTVTTTLGSSTPYDGTFYDPEVDGDQTLTTLIASSQRRDIDNGVARSYADYIGLHVTFTTVTEMSTFGLVDLDGSDDAGNEWASSFALNGAVSVLPTVGAGNTDITVVLGQAVSWGGIANAPANANVAWQSADVGNVTPNDPSGQVAFDYNGQEVTDLYFLFGVREETGRGGKNNSGLTGFTVFEAEPIPEPSSAILFGLGALGLIAHRRR